MQLIQVCILSFIKTIIFKKRETLKVANTFYESYYIHGIAMFTCNPSEWSTLAEIQVGTKLN
jgi:hypothetical protein